MAKNLSREYATMSEDERRRFKMKSEGGTDAAPEELVLENPRGDEETTDEGSDEAANESPPPDRPA
jgi:hypothetical protein